MMEFLVELALKAGVPQRFAKIAVIGALVTALVLGLGLAKCAYDKSIISNHDAQQSAANAKADRAADTHAADQRRSDDSRLTNEQEQLEGVRTDAKPQSDLDRRLARQRCIRLQQTARRDGKQPPACG
jgi:hypothetical protein